MNTDSKSETCFDRRILNGKDNPPSGYLWRDIVGMIVWFCAAGVATACGVGGGGIYVPLGMLLLNFAPKPSSGLSQASIFGASLGGLALNIRNRHPFTSKCQHTANGTTFTSCEMEAPPSTENVTYHNRPLIDYDMALFLAPMEMAGAVLGVIIQKLLPNVSNLLLVQNVGKSLESFSHIHFFSSKWLYLTLAAIILGFTAHKTYAKFWDTHGKEKAKREAEQLAALTAAAEEEQEPLRDDKEDPQSCDETDHDDHHHEIDSSSSEPVGDSDATADARCEQLLAQDARQFPKEKLFALLILWIGLILLTFFKGGKGVDSIVGITCASPWYAVLIGIQFLWTLGFSCIFALRLMKQTEEKKKVGYPFHPQDVLWDFSKTRFYAFFTFIAGIVAGLIGIGGGMVLGPLMLVMGIHPRVSSATTATMIVLTSSSVAVLFVTAGMVPWAYAVAFFSICLCGAFIGKKYIDGYVKKTGKASILIFMLATIIALATIGCIVIVLTRLASNDWCFAGFNNFCNLKEEDSDEDMCVVNQFLRL